MVRVFELTAEREKEMRVWWVNEESIKSKTGGCLGRRCNVSVMVLGKGRRPSEGRKERETKRKEGKRKGEEGKRKQLSTQTHPHHRLQPKGRAPRPRQLIVEIIFWKDE